MKINFYLPTNTVCSIIQKLLTLFCCFFDVVDEVWLFFQHLKKRTINMRWLMGSVTNTRGCIPGIEPGISHNEPGTLQIHCVILYIYHLRGRRPPPRKHYIGKGSPCRKRLICFKEFFRLKNCALCTFSVFEEYFLYSI